MPLMATAQESGDDMGVWASVEATKKIDKKLSVGAEAELRTRDDAGEIDRWSLGVNAQYKLNSWLKASAGYTFLRDNNERYSFHDDGSYNKRADYWGNRHRFNVSLTASKKLGNFTLSLRERWQYTYRPEYTVDERYDYDKQDYDGKEKTYHGKGKNVLRSRLKLDYAIPQSNLSPYASVEAYNAWSVQKMRYTLGIDWKINKQNSLGVYYRYQKPYGSDDFDTDRNMHILGVGYSLKF